MAIQYNQLYGTWVTPQSMAIPGQEHKQAKNNAGGYSYTITDWQRYARFLLLGSSSGTYYVTPQKLTIENAKAARACIVENGKRAVDELVYLSLAGRARSNDPALFALAMASAADNVATRQYALSQLSKVARTGTHLLHFCAYANVMRGWGRSLQTAVANWFNDKPVDKLAYQVVKYQSRDGWSMRDALRVSHPKTNDGMRNALYKWIVDGADDGYISVPLIQAYENAKLATSKEEMVSLIMEHGLTREMIPTNWLNSVGVWEALLEKMPPEAMLRNLGKISSMLDGPTWARNKVISTFSDKDTIRKARLHPIKILEALRTYEQGHGLKGSLTWTPNREICNVLDQAFYLAFEAVPVLNKRVLLSLDVSGSMTSKINGGVLSSCEVSAAFAMLFMKRAEQLTLRGFCHKLVDLPIRPNMTLKQAMDIAYQNNFGSTDCAVPMIEAKRNSEKFDAFVCITDGETWAGKIHPSQALRDYRNSSGIAAKSVFLATEATGFSLADPDDFDSLDIGGFDTSVPTVVQNFVGGEINGVTDNDE